MTPRGGDEATRRDRAGEASPDAAPRWLVAVIVGLLAIAVAIEGWIE